MGGRTAPNRGYRIPLARLQNNLRRYGDVSESFCERVALYFQLCNGVILVRRHGNKRCFWEVKVRHVATVALFFYSDHHSIFMH